MYVGWTKIFILAIWWLAVTAALPVDLDQTADASSIVDDYSYYHRKIHRRLHHKRRLPIFRTVQAHSHYNGLDSSPSPIETDCFQNCDGVVAIVGESRSYSIAKGTSPETETSAVTAEDTTPLTTEVVKTEPASLTKENPVSPTAVQRSQLNVDEVEPKSEVKFISTTPLSEKSSTPEPSHISYETSLTSATSASRVSFYRAPPKHATRIESVSYTEEVVRKPENRSFQLPNIQERDFSQAQGLPQVYGKPEENYEVDEALSVITNGRAHGVQPKLDTNKFGYVVEGRDFKKYRVEERTADGFIVGEYGVVRHDDGSLRGVRYTADSTINPKVIYEALVKFLSL